MMATLTVLVWPLIGTPSTTESMGLTTAKPLYSDYTKTDHVLKELPVGTKFTVISTENGWTKIKLSDGSTGWVSGLDPNQNPEETTFLDNPIDQVATISSLTANIYALAQKQSQVLGSVNKGDHLFLLRDFGNGWLQVQYNGQVGWLDAKEANIHEIVSVIAGEDVPLYEKSSVTSPVLTSLSAGTTLQVLENQGQFLKVSYQEWTGFIETDLVNFSIGTMRNLLRDQASLPTTASNKKILVTRLNGTPINQEADANSRVVETLSSGTIIDYQDRQGDYYRITLKDGSTGYLGYWLVSTNFPSIESDSTIPSSLATATIVIDAGHGGDDPGAVVDFSSVHEKDLTLSTANKLKSLLEAVGTKVIMTRSDDSSVSLINRAEIANAADADIFISIHYDASETDSLSGTTTYYYNQNNRSLANTINKYLAMRLRLPNNGYYFENYAVLRENSQPAVLLELGYINNRSDNSIISTPSYQEDVATAILEALQEYFQP